MITWHVNVRSVYDANNKPVAGAFVDYEPIPDYVGAVTLTDSADGFVLCGLPMNQPVLVGVGFEGRAVWVEVPPGQCDGDAITLPR